VVVHTFGIKLNGQKTRKTNKIATKKEEKEEGEEIGNRFQKV
jgi:hypothetical protein